MKKQFYMMIIVMLCLVMDIEAQSDGFFISYSECLERESDEWGELLLLPDKHNVDYNYPADKASLDAGLLIMSGIGLAYANYKRKR